MAIRDIHVGVLLKPGIKRDLVAARPTKATIEGCTHSNWHGHIRRAQRDCVMAEPRSGDRAGSVSAAVGVEFPHGAAPARSGAAGGCGHGCRRGAAARGADGLSGRLPGGTDRNLRTVVHPPNIAPIGLKLCQNAFQTIPNISFSDVEKSFSSDLFGREHRFRLFSSSFGVAGIFRL